MLKTSHRIWSVYALALCALVALFYAPLGEHLLDTHDRDYLLDSADVLEDISFFFAVDKRMPGRPFFELLLLAEYAVWGDSARLFHLAGVLLHALAAWALAYTCWKLGVRLQTALLAGWLFAINSAPFQAVHWISAHCYILALLCVLWGLLAFLRFVETGQWHSLATVVFAWGLGVLSHISAAVFVPCALYLAWRRHLPMGRAFMAAALLGFVVLGLVWNIRGYYETAPQNSIIAHSFDVWAVLYNYLFFWGRLLVSAHGFPTLLGAISEWEVALGGLAFVLGMAAVVRGTRPLAEVAIWIGLALLPPLLLDPQYVRTIPAGPSRYLYLASGGTALLLAALIVALCAPLFRRRRLWGRLGYGGIVVLLTASSLLAVRQAEAISFYNEGRNYLAAGQIELGIRQLEKALAVDGSSIDREDAYVRLCPMLLNRGEDAEACLTTARRFYPRNPTLHVYAQVLSSLQGDAVARRRLDSFKGKGAIARVIAEAYHHAGRGAFRRAIYAEAVAAFHRALVFDARRDDTRQSLRAARTALAARM